MTQPTAEPRRVHTSRLLQRACANAMQAVVTLVVFAVCVALWCLAGVLLTRHKRVTETVSRYGHWILPAAFILIGLYILHETAGPLSF